MTKEIEVNPDVVRRITRYVIHYEENCLRNKSKTDAVMIAQIMKKMEEEVECYLKKSN